MKLIGLADDEMTTTLKAATDAAHAAWVTLHEARLIVYIADAEKAAADDTKPAENISNEFLQMAGHGVTDDHVLTAIYEKATTCT